MHVGSLQSSFVDVTGGNSWSCLTKTIGASLTIHYLVTSVSVVVTFDSLSQDNISEDVVPVVSHYDNHHFPNLELQYCSKYSILY